MLRYAMLFRCLLTRIMRKERRRRVVMPPSPIAHHAYASTFLPVHATCREMSHYLMFLLPAYSYAILRSDMPFCSDFLP